MKPNIVGEGYIFAGNLRPTREICILSQAVLSEHVAACDPRLVSPWHEFVEAAIQESVDDQGDRLVERGVRIHVVELAGLDERGNDSPVFAATIGASKQSIPAIKGDRADGSLDDIVVDLDATVVNEAGEARPA